MKHRLRKKIMTGQGTVFQKSVWSVLLEIPRGTTWTYAQVATHAGKPRAVRAVATAIGQNPYAPDVPCHRVVLSSGRVGKYAFGQKKKLELLKSEGVRIKKGRVEK